MLYFRVIRHDMDAPNDSHGDFIMYAVHFMVGHLFDAILVPYSSHPHDDLAEFHLKVISVIVTSNVIGNSIYK